MNEPGFFTYSFYALGTQCDILLTDVKRKEADRIFQIVKQEAEKLSFVLTDEMPDSPLAKLNHAKRDKWVDVTDETLWDVLTICYDFWQMSNGAFDITVAPIVKLWQNSTGETIRETDMKKAKERSGFDKVELDHEQHKLKFLGDNMGFNPGAIAKGIAIDTIKPVLLREGIKNGVVSFGEASILALGNHPDGGKWPLGIRNALNPAEYVHLFSAQNTAVTTSGTITVSDDGKTVRKIVISPATGYPVESNRTVSVLSESATMGAFLSTAFLILPENDRNLIVEKVTNIELLEVDYTDDNDFKTKLTMQ